MSSVKKSFWNLPVLNSRTDRQKVTLPEMIFGYFLGPLLVLAMTSVVATYYLTFYRTYDDVVAQGNFLVLLPLISIIPMALANIIVGIVLGKTKTKQGKARPFILVAGPLLLGSGIVMFVMPYFSLGFRMAWMAVTYNLFAALANPIYSNAHYLMVSLSTRLPSPSASPALIQLRIAGIRILETSPLPATAGMFATTDSLPRWSRSLVDRDTIR